VRQLLTRLHYGTFSPAPWTGPRGACGTGTGGSGCLSQWCPYPPGGWATTSQPRRHHRAQAWGGGGREGARRRGGAHHLNICEPSQDQRLEQLAPDAAGADHEHCARGGGLGTRAAGGDAAAQRPTTRLSCVAHHPVTWRPRTRLCGPALVATCGTRTRRASLSGQMTWQRCGPRQSISIAAHAAVSR
jgi:hypothetical protein